MIANLLMQAQCNRPCKPDAPVVDATPVSCCNARMESTAMHPPKWRQQLALALPGRRPGCLWVHACSMGEVNSVAPLIESLLANGHAVHLTVVTRTGHQQARRLFADAITLSYLPWDLPGTMCRLVHRLSPSLLLLTETEFWPGMLAACKRRGIPVIGMSMCMGGMTAPVTLAGTLVTLNAEALASLVITQSAAPGAPHIYCSEATMADMTTGFIGYRGPEAPMVFTAAAQMARRYGLPRMTGIIGVDAPRPGVDIPFGELAALMLTTMSGTDLCSGVGGLNLDAGCSLEQMVIDAVNWEEYRAYMRPFSVDEASAALDVIREVGAGGSFLSHPHTTKHFRSQLFFRSKKAKAYGATMSTGMVADARDIVRKTLREHTVEPVDAKALARGDDILRRYEDAVPVSL